MMKKSNEIVNFMESQVRKEIKGTISVKYKYFVNKTMQQTIFAEHIILIVHMISLLGQQNKE